MTIRLRIALTAILAAACGSACDVRVNEQGVSLDVSEGGRAEDESTRSYPLAKGGRLEIDTAFSEVELVRSDVASVDVRVRRRVRAKTDQEAQALLKEQYFTIETGPDLVSIKAIRPEGAEAFRRRVRVDYRVSVPVGSRVTIKNENGTVTLGDVDGRFIVNNTNGRIHGRRVTGGFEAQTVNGMVILELLSVTGDVRITTVNGHALVGLPPKMNGTIEASAINGAVFVREDLEVAAATKDRQRLSGRLGTGSGPKIELHTTNGNVRVGTGAPPT
jgi:hypothetical protein